MNEINFKTTSCDEQVKSEVIRIANNLRGYKLSDCCKLINDYLKETVTALDFTDENIPCSTSYDALILKKSNSYGYISAFEAILKELGVSEDIFSKKEYCFHYEGKVYVFEYLNVRYIEGGSKNEFDLIFSPYTEKICNQRFINHDIWFRTYTQKI